MSETGDRRRLAAILAADAAGYSRLMTTDEDATVAALDAARSVFKARIEGNQGRIIDMAGDSVLAVFETATGAVSAALAIQKELESSADTMPEDRRMRFRIGVHLGDVIEKADGTIYGDGVNIAARLQAMAEPGGVTVSGMVQEAVRDRIAAAFEDQGEHEVKNIARPVRVYRIDLRGDGVSAAPGAIKKDVQPERRRRLRILVSAAGTAWRVDLVGRHEVTKWHHYAKLRIGVAYPDPNRRYADLRPKLKTDAPRSFKPTS